MIEKPETFIAMWIAISALAGFLLGEGCGELRRHRKCLQQANEELRHRLHGTPPESIERALKDQRSVINDIHRRLVAVSKGLEKRPL